MVGMSDSRRSNTALPAAEIFTAEPPPSLAKELIRR
jgi:hypothetical protein